MYKESKAFKGFEVWFHALKMSFKMHLYCMLTILLLHLTLVFLYFLLFRTEIVALFLRILFSFQFQYFPKLFIISLKAGWAVFILASPVWFLYPVALAKFKAKAQEITKDEYLRGARLLKEEEVLEELRKRYRVKDERGLIKVGKKIFIPRQIENRHFLLVGRSGVGKTTLLNQVIEKLRERGEKAIIYDVKGDYLSFFYDPKTDYIFNPLDKRSLHWCLFDEIETIADIDSIATSLIPPSYREDKFWVDAARDIFSAIVYYLFITGQRTNEALWQYVSLTEGELLEVMQQAVAQGCEVARRALGYLQGYEKGSKVASDTLSTMKQYTNCFYYTRHLGNDWSLKKWLSEEGSSFLFITNYSTLRDTLKPLLSLLIDLSMKHLLSLQEDIERRRFIILDEFASLQRLTSIVQALEQGRSKGVSIWIALQDLSQLQRVYSEVTAFSIMNNTNTILAFAVNDPNTTQLLSRLYGEIELLETDESLSMGPADARDGLVLQRRRKKEYLLIPSQFSTLQDFCFYIKMLDIITQSKVEFKEFKKRNESFILNELFKL
jgi:type IV secretory pathway TraG/TraD family ATPase VirD4